MILPVLIGLAVLAFFFLATSGSKARANLKALTNSKQLLGWVAVIGLVFLEVMLLAKGGTVAAIGPAILLGPVVWNLWQANRRPPKPGAGPKPGPDAAGRKPFGPNPFAGAFRAPPRSGMSEEEAYQVLGIAPGATPADIRAAHLRLVRAVHPDSGGSADLAARVNSARDVLLRGR